MKAHEALLVFIRSAMSLILSRTNALPDKSEKLKNFHDFVGTLYSYNDAQYAYIENRWESLFAYLVETFPDNCNATDSYSLNRLSISNLIYYTFVSTFFSMRDHLEYDLEYMSSLEILFVQAETYDFPYEALLYCVEFHRNTVKHVIYLEKQ